MTSNATDVNDVLNAFKNILSSLENVEKVDEVVNQLHSNGEQKVLKQFKHIINNVHSTVEVIRKKVYEAYKDVKLNKNVINSNINTSDRSSDETSTEKNHSMHLDRDDKNGTGKSKHEKKQETNDTTVESMERKNGEYNDINSVTLNNRNLEEKSINKENLPETETEVVIKPSATTRPLIKLVDINKLMAPNNAPLLPTDDDLSSSPSKPKKSVTFDSSIIILSSSDEETPKKNPKEKQNSPLKSAMRKSSNHRNTVLKLRARTKKNKKDGTRDYTIIDSDSDSDNCKLSMIKANIVNKNVTKKNIENTHNTSSNLDQEIHSNDHGNSATKTHRSDSIKLNDSKLRRQVYIPLPSYKLEELADLYKKKKKDIFSIKKKLSCNNQSRKRILCEDLNENKDEYKRRKLTHNTHQLKIKNLNKVGDQQNNENKDQNDEVNANSEVVISTSLNENEMKNDECTADDCNNKNIGSSSIVRKDKLKNVAMLSDSESNDNNNEDTDSSNENDHNKKRDNTKSKKMLKKYIVSDSDSNDDVAKTIDNNNDSNRRSESESDDKKSSGDESISDLKKRQKISGRKRIKKNEDSSDENDDTGTSTRKNIRKMITRDSLSETTRKAEQDEKERKSRIAEKQKKYNQLFDLKLDAVATEVVLDFDEKKERPLLSVNKKIVERLKPHQIHGIKFMWDACFESLEQIKSSPGSGCVLAHCMGLGKTLQVITLIHTLLSNSNKSSIEKVLVVCPLNTVLNWKSEFEKWLPKNNVFEVYELVSCKSSSVNYERSYIVKEWHENGGVLIIAYTMYRTLTNPSNKTIPKKIRIAFHNGLVDPGPDLVVCDEGHLLKNEKTSTSIAMNRIKTTRRIVLTGTPLQNNLKEYWCMVQFIKPNLLGTYKEYLNRFVNPITNGQYTDSTPHDIQLMRKRSHVLHKLLDGVVQRQDYSVLEPYLPPKYEYVLFLKLTEIQIKLYKYYMENLARRINAESNRTTFLFNDFQELQRICTHPRVLLEKSIENKDKLIDQSDSEGSLKDFIDDGSNEEDGDSSDESNSNSDVSIIESDKKLLESRRRPLTRAKAAERKDNNEEDESDDQLDEPKEWWQQFIEKDEIDNINLSSKIFLLFAILKECEEIGDKSLYTLNCIEYFLQNVGETIPDNDVTDKLGGQPESWLLGLDYFRLDGSSSCDNRAAWCDQFNNVENTRARLFLISTRAGGLGINLVAANRVIIFDVSWNPSHDIQSIYRVYRFGQTKPCYVYRFVTYGAMEMKIYERQVTKQAISKRVIDEQQIDRHYSQHDIMELYKTNLDDEERPIPLVPKDVLLGEMLQKYEKTIFKYHEHQTLLENKEDEVLNEEERKAAWEEFENEKLIRNTVTNMNRVNFGAFQNGGQFSTSLIQNALANIIRRDNPTWSDVQIRGVVPALVQQLQIQISENNLTLFNRVRQEIFMMQMLNQQNKIQHNLQHRHFLIEQQRQQQINQSLDDLNITPEEIQRLQQMGGSNLAANNVRSHPSLLNSNVIELTDE